MAVVVLVLSDPEVAGVTVPTGVAEGGAAFTWKAFTCTDLRLELKETRMKLKTVYVRFYKSFNYDYLRKAHTEAVPAPWDEYDDAFYPFVVVPVDASVTAVVGENESGKSHLLDAIRKGITGADIAPEDFCRHSRFFSVADGPLPLPEFGFEFESLSDRDLTTLQDGAASPLPDELARLYVFRYSGTTLRAFVPTEGSVEQRDIDNDALSAVMPHVFRINPRVSLPDSVSMRLMSKGASDTTAHVPRSAIDDMLEWMQAKRGWFDSPDEFNRHGEEIRQAIVGVTAPTQGEAATDELQLARDLLFTVARVGPDVIEEIRSAVRRGDDGFANGLVQQINGALKARLNFPEWWAQDRKFQLRVTARETELVFTILDRTGTEYSFGERSQGLKYFLSYYIQYLAHSAPEDGRSEILLMDEPDAFLSSQGQQDLLRIFDRFAHPVDGRPPVQVFYVTHSPFLIDKNHGERVRVLRKGEEEEGTRVVRDVSRNHYEPLRSSLGVMVGETAFIGHCNLMVEGLSDQILIVGASNHLRGQDASVLDTLDLNELTIVPAGSASHVPYLVYLAIGRDVEQPAVIVLLDDDQAGRQARRQLKGKGPLKRSRLPDEYILLLSDLSPSNVGRRIPRSPKRRLTEIEDLVPAEIAERAVREYLETDCNAPAEVVETIQSGSVLAECSDEVSLWTAVEKVTEAVTGGNYHIEKVGFAKAVVSVVSRMAASESLAASETEALAEFEGNMTVLLQRLEEMRRAADRELRLERVSSRVKREVKAFVADFVSSARKEDALIGLERIESVLDESPESEEYRAAIRRLKRQHNLDSDLTDELKDFEGFREDLSSLVHAPKLAELQGP